MTVSRKNPLQENRFYRDKNLTPDNIIAAFEAAGWIENRDWIGRDDDLTFIKSPSRISFNIQPNAGYDFIYYKTFEPDEFSSDYMMYSGRNLTELQKDIEDIKCLKDTDFMKHKDPQYLNFLLGGSDNKLTESKRVTVTFSDNQEAEDFKNEIRQRYHFPKGSSKFAVQRGVGRSGKAVFIEDILNETLDLCLYGKKCLTEETAQKYFDWLITTGLKKVDWLKTGVELDKQLDKVNTELRFYNEIKNPAYRRFDYFEGQSLEDFIEQFEALLKKKFPKQGTHKDYDRVKRYVRTVFNNYIKHFQGATIGANYKKVADWIGRK